MICYKTHLAYQNDTFEFQTKLTYGMICYLSADSLSLSLHVFQTKLTYGMICYILMMILLP